MVDVTNEPESQPPPQGEGWLSPFLPELQRVGPRLLELGCGPGFDAAALAVGGFDVTAFDRITLDAARRNAPGVRLLRADLARTLPFRDAAFDAAVASLSLHYLPWAHTLAAFGEVRRVLGPGAPFLFRVNATDDFEHGAGEGEIIEPNFYRTPGHIHAGSKRFFDEAAVRAALRERFEMVHLAHTTINRDDAPKRVWECLALAR